MKLTDYIANTLIIVSETAWVSTEVKFDIGIFVYRDRDIETICVDETSLNRIKFTVSIASREEQYKAQDFNICIPPIPQD